MNREFSDLRSRSAVKGRDADRDVYTRLSRWYDSVFPVDAPERAFLEHHFRPCASVLDIGCGTGAKTVCCARPGNRVLGVDLNAAMIERACRMRAREGVAFEVLNMARIRDRFALERFAAVLCLGNTLVHHPSEAAVEKFLLHMAGIMEPDGVLAVQILNYDRILDDRIFTLPEIETSAVRFSRTYQPDGSMLLFTTELVEKHTGTRLSASAPLLPLRPARLLTLLEQAGLVVERLLGGYEDAPFQACSPWLLCLCRRRGKDGASEFF